MLMFMILCFMMHACGFLAPRNDVVAAFCPQVEKTRRHGTVINQYLN